MPAILRPRRRTPESHMPVGPRPATHEKAYGRAMTYTVEAYVAESDRLLWRSTGMDDPAAYDLAIRVDADPRIEVLLIHVDDNDGSESIVIVEEQEGEPGGGAQV